MRISPQHRTCSKHNRAIRAATAGWWQTVRGEARLRSAGLRHGD